MRLCERVRPRVLRPLQSRRTSAAGWFLKVKTVGIQHGWNKASKYFKETLTQEQLKKLVPHLTFLA